jgi:anti-anti-sigma factor
MAEQRNDGAQADVIIDTAGDRAMARVSGEVDLSNADAVGTSLTELLASAGPGMVVDLSEVEFLDSSGLRMLLVLGSTAKENDQDFHLVVGEGSFVAHLMEVTRVKDILAVHPTLDDLD